MDKTAERIYVNNMRNKDREFDKILSDLSFKDGEEPNFNNMTDILNKIREYTSTEESFNKNKDFIANLLYSLSAYVYCVKHSCDFSIGGIPGSHDYNVCLSPRHFDQKLYKDWYEKYCESVKIIADSKGMKYPRVLYEIDACPRLKEAGKQKWYRVYTLIFISGKDLPEDKFGTPTREDILNGTFDKIDLWKLGLDKIGGRYYRYIKNLASADKCMQKYEEFSKNEGRD